MCVCVRVVARFNLFAMRLIHTYYAFSIVILNLIHFYTLVLNDGLFVKYNTINITDLANSKVVVEKYLYAALSTLSSLLIINK